MDLATKGKIKMKKIIYLMIISLMSMNLYAEEKYITLDTQEIESNKVIIQEFFFYGCPHCFRLESDLKGWKDELDFEKVVFEQVPVDFGSLSNIASNHHYAAEVLGVLNEFTELYFDEINLKKSRITDDVAVRVLISLGIKKEKAIEAINSFIVKSKTEKAKMMTKKYKINAVPSFIVNGKYYVDSNTVGTPKELIKVLSAFK